MSLWATLLKLKPDVFLFNKSLHYIFCHLKLKFEFMLLTYVVTTFKGSIKG